MANSLFKGVSATKAAKTIPDLQEEGQYGGKLRKMYDKYVLLADLASGDSIDMGNPIPEGARITNAILTTTALGGSCTLDVGWRAGTELEPQAGGNTEEALDKTAFFSAIAVSSATVAAAHGNASEGDFYQHILTSPVQIAVWEHAVSSGATGGIIQLEVDYVVN